MKNRKTYYTPNRIQATLIVAVCFLLLNSAPALARPDDFDTDKAYIASPGHTPFFENVSAPQMKPGNSGTLKIVISNRYDMALADFSFTLEIYLWSQIEESEKNISSINSPPYFLSSQNQSFTMIQGSFPSNATLEIKDLVKTSGDCPEGTYFVRTSSTFNYNGTVYTLKSRGHFSKELWNEATLNGDDEHDDTGAVNLELLQVDAILTEITFGVKKPFVLWPIYLFSSLTIISAMVAVTVYLIEQESYPWLNKRAEEFRRKFNQLWPFSEDGQGKS